MLHIPSWRRPTCSLLISAFAASLAAVGCVQDELNGTRTASSDDGYQESTESIEAHRDKFESQSEPPGTISRRPKSEDDVEVQSPERLRGPFDQNQLFELPAADTRVLSGDEWRLPMAAMQEKWFKARATYGATAKKTGISRTNLLAALNSRDSTGQAFQYRFEEIVREDTDEFPRYYQSSLNPDIVLTTHGANENLNSFTLSVRYEDYLEFNEDGTEVIDARAKQFVDCVRRVAGLFEPDAEKTVNDYLDEHPNLMVLCDWRSLRIDHLWITFSLTSPGPSRPTLMDRGPPQSPAIGHYSLDFEVGAYQLGRN